MGWSFHKSIKIGPFRLNIGKTGIGFSVGSHGFRTGVRSNGSTYNSVSIPGTGIRYTTGGKKSSGGNSWFSFLIRIIFIPVSFWI